MNDVDSSVDRAFQVDVAYQVDVAVLSNSQLNCLGNVELYVAQDNVFVNCCASQNSDNVKVNCVLCSLSKSCVGSAVAEHEAGVLGDICCLEYDSAGVADVEHHAVCFVSRKESSDPASGAGVLVNASQVDLVLSAVSVSDVEDTAALSLVGIYLEKCVALEEVVSVLFGNVLIGENVNCQSFGDLVSVCCHEQAGLLS